MTLEELILNCKKQDLKAQEELYKKFSGILFAVCLKYSPNYHEAEDNLQDAFLTIFQRIEQFKSKGSFEGWMKRVAINTVLQKYRKKKTFHLSNEEQIEEEEEVVEVEDNQVPLDFLLKIVQELPNKYRLVFTMYVLDDYSHKEIADSVGISVGTSKSNLARARGILKIKIEDYYKVKSKNIHAMAGIADLSTRSLVTFVDNLKFAKELIEEGKIVFVFGVGGNDKKNSSSWLLENWDKPEVQRLWGKYRNLDNNGHWQVKELSIDVKKSLSDQKHFVRSEHWHIVDGKLEMNLEFQNGYKTSKVYTTGDSIDIPPCTWHKAINVGKNPVKVIEVWMGDLLSEDDIERRD